jgi:[ribosomal protein S5]-alanine N-acetyltransferase
MLAAPAFRFEWRPDVYLDLEVPPSSDQVDLFLLTPEHVTDAYVAWLNDPSINQYLESRYAVHTVESVRVFVRSMLDSPDNLLLGIHSHATGTHVGNIKLGPIDSHHRTAEMGILVGAREAWGRGIGTSAIVLLSDLARERLLLRKVTAGCYASNVGSRRAFEKAGFLVEGIRARQVLLDGCEEDLVVLGKCLTEPR